VSGKYQTVRLNTGHLATYYYYVWLKLQFCLDFALKNSSLAFYSDVHKISQVAYNKNVKSVSIPGLEKPRFKFF